MKLKPQCRFRFLAVIPARAGSKGVSGKNIKLLAGKPLIYYTILEAKKSKYLDRIVVSTDGKKIAALSEQVGVEVVMRPKKLATAKARTELALLHVLEMLKRREGYVPDAVVTLEPTSPMRSHQTIDCSIEAWIKTGADTVVTVAETSSLVGKIKNGQFQYLIPDQPRRRQDREPLYKESSTVYVTGTKALVRTKSVIGKKPVAVVVGREEALDINNSFDFVLAEAAKRWKQGIKRS